MIIKSFSLITATHVPDTGYHVRSEGYQTYMQIVRSFLSEIEGQAQVGKRKPSRPTIGTTYSKR
ncbi:MAG: hypothetical protein ACK2U1_08300 [Anaerolineales bacterium]|jgi:hypothetical protein